MISDDIRSEMPLITVKINRKPFMGAKKASGASASTSIDIHILSSKTIRKALDLRS